MSGLRPGRILVSEAELQTRVHELGRAIARDCAAEALTTLGVPIPSPAGAPGGGGR